MKKSKPRKKQTKKEEQEEKIPSAAIILIAIIAFSILFYMLFPKPHQEPPMQQQPAPLEQQSAPPEPSEENLIAKNISQVFDSVALFFSQTRNMSVTIKKVNIIKNNDSRKGVIEYACSRAMGYKEETLFLRFFTNKIGEIYPQWYGSDGNSEIITNGCANPPSRRIWQGEIYPFEQKNS
jgi:hypothetical protein